MGTLAPRKAEVVIYQGDDMAELADLHRRVEVAKRAVEAAKGTSLRLGDESPGADVEAAQAAYDEFVDAAAERAVTVELRSIGRRRFRDLMADHPPRQVQDTSGETDGLVDHEDDAGYGVNTATFSKALLMFVDPDDDEVRTVNAPRLGTKALSEFLDDELAEGDFERIWNAAYMLNRAVGADPKALSSGEPRSSTVISESPARLG